MDIYIYSDESGVLDYKHHKYYIFGGVVFCSVDDRDAWNRRYIAAENNIRNIECQPSSIELKASVLSNGSKNKLYKLLSRTERSGAVIDEQKLNRKLFDNKKEKQRYLDWVFKLAIKTKFEDLLRRGILQAQNVSNLFFYTDEHTTATDGIYELRESLEHEFKFGTINYIYNSFYPPIFPDVSTVNLHFCNSAKKPLIRAADIIANHLLYQAYNNNGIIPEDPKLHIYYHP